MGILDKIKKIGKEEVDKRKAEKSEKEAPKKEKKAKKEPKKVKVAKGIREVKVLDVITKPRVTEKSTDLGMLGKYVFEIDPRLGKPEVKEAIQQIYGVKVTKINIVIGKPKARRMGRTQGFKAGYKKAIVTLQEGDKIELFANV